MTDIDIEAVRDYIRTHEHEDDWDTPCVYTGTLRVLLGMEKSAL